MNDSLDNSLLAAPEPAPRLPNPALLETLIGGLPVEEDHAREATASGRAPCTGIAQLDEELGGYLAPGGNTLLVAPGAGPKKRGAFFAPVEPVEKLGPLSPAAPTIVLCEAPFDALFIAADKIGAQLSNFASTVERLRPVGAKDWSEFLLHYRMQELRDALALRLL